MFSRRSLLKTAPAAFLGGFAAGAARDAVVTCAAPAEITPDQVEKLTRFSIHSACHGTDTMTPREEADAVFAAWELAERFARKLTGDPALVHVGGYAPFSEKPEKLLSVMMHLEDGHAHATAERTGDEPNALVVYRGVRENTITKASMVGYHMFRGITLRHYDGGTLIRYAYDFWNPKGWKYQSTLSRVEDFT